MDSSSPIVLLYTIEPQLLNVSLAQYETFKNLLNVMVQLKKKTSEHKQSCM